MRRLIFGILVMLAVFLASLLCQASEKLQIEIWSDKTEYLPIEPIVVHYAIQKVGDEAANVNRYSLEGCFRIEDEQGIEYPIGILAVTLAFAPPPLKPNHTLKGDKAIDGFLEPGKYICYLQCPGWTDTLVADSNKFELTVKEPVGKEKEALEMFVEAGTVEIVEEENQGRCPKRGEAEFLKYQALVEKYPNSIYTPLALREAIGIYFYSRDLQERRKIIPVCKRLIENYPNSLYFASAFMSLVDVYEINKDKQAAIKTMQELIQKHPNTKISERAEYWLEKIEKWEFK